MPKPEQPSLPLRRLVAQTLVSHPEDAPEAQHFGAWQHVPGSDVVIELPVGSRVVIRHVAEVPALQGR